MSADAWWTAESEVLAQQAKQVELAAAEIAAWKRRDEARRAMLRHESRMADIREAVEDYSPDEVIEAMTGEPSELIDRSTLLRFRLNYLRGELAEAASVLYPAVRDALGVAL